MGSRMSSGAAEHDRDYLELVFLHALRALPSSEIPTLEAHLSACAECRQEMEALRPIVGAFVSWPTDVLRPPESLWSRLAQRIAAETRQAPVLLPPQPPGEPAWQEAAPGLSYKVLAADTDKDRVSLLVRLAPGSALPTSLPCRSRRAVPAPRRAVDRRQEALSRGLQPGGGGHRRSACLERDRLRVRSPHVHARRTSVISSRS
jgi:hypothetical protein